MTTTTMTIENIKTVIKEKTVAFKLMTEDFEVVSIVFSKQDLLNYDEDDEKDTISAILKTATETKDLEVKPNFNSGYIKIRDMDSNAFIIFVGSDDFGTLYRVSPDVKLLRMIEEAIKDIRKNVKRTYPISEEEVSDHVLHNVINNICNNDDVLDLITKLKTDTDFSSREALYSTIIAAIRK